MVARSITRIAIDSEIFEENIETANFRVTKDNYYWATNNAITPYVVVVTRPLLRNEGMAEDHAASEAGQLHRAWTRGRTETESRQRVSDAKSP